MIFEILCNFLKNDLILTKEFKIMSFIHRHFSELNDRQFTIHTACPHTKFPANHKYRKKTASIIALFRRYSWLTGFMFTRFSLASIILLLETLDFVGILETLSQRTWYNNNYSALDNLFISTKKSNYSSNDDVFIRTLQT